METELNGKPELVAEPPPYGASDGKLLHNSKQSLDQKDFNAEIRGLQDVRGLLERCSVLLDLEVGTFMVDVDTHVKSYRTSQTVTPPPPVWSP